MKITTDNKIDRLLSCMSKIDSYLCSTYKIMGASITAFGLYHIISGYSSMDVSGNMDDWLVSSNLGLVAFCSGIIELSIGVLGFLALRYESYISLCCLGVIVLSLK